MGIGVGLSYVTKAANGSIDAQVPHPLVFGRPRTVSGGAELARNETVVNVQALWMVPFDGRWQLSFAVASSSIVSFPPVDLPSTLDLTVRAPTTRAHSI